MSVLQNLQPANVFKFFEEICAIPHGSENMEPIANYCINFAKERNLEYYTDDMHNVIIVKEGTEGYENSPAIIVQGHLDMVCEKTADRDIDFLTDGLEIYVDGDKVRAKGTTLGGDNGIAVAMALAILDSNEIAHPRLEAVFTVDEETGLYGAEAIDVSMLKAKMFLNLDSEDECVITVSCAGGITAEGTIPVVREEVAGEKVKVTVDGLLGGHSGIEINQGRGNATVLLARLLCAAAKKTQLNVVSLVGGRKDNAIPKEASAEIIVADVAAFEEAANKVAAELKDEFKTSDPSINVTVEKLGAATENALNLDSTTKAISFALLAPNGIIAMSADIEGLVETSLNLGVYETTETDIVYVSGLRSSIESAKWALVDRFEAMVNMVGGKVEFTGNYPGWAYMKDSKLRETAIEVYKQHYGKEPVVEAIHAGLECGMFSEKIDGLDCISIGPTLKDVHTVDESMDIPSVQRTWEVVLDILKVLK